MSQRGDSENDIWDYKSLGKRKKQPPPPAAEPKRRYTSRKSTKKVTSFPTKSAEIGDGRTGVDTPVDRQNSPDAHNLPSESSTTGASQSDGEGSSGDFCPMCQMPFSILVVQTQRWHVAECLDTPRDKCKGEASMFISAPQIIHIQASICICLLLCCFIALLSIIQVCLESRIAKSCTKNTIIQKYHIYYLTKSNLIASALLVSC